MLAGVRTRLVSLMITLGTKKKRGLIQGGHLTSNNLHPLYNCRLHIQNYSIYQSTHSWSRERQHSSYLPSRSEAKTVAAAT